MIQLIADLVDYGTTKNPKSLASKGLQAVSPCYYQSKQLYLTEILDWQALARTRLFQNKPNQLYITRKPYHS